MVPPVSSSRRIPSAMTLPPGSGIGFSFQDWLVGWLAGFWILFGFGFCLGFRTPRIKSASLNSLRDTSSRIESFLRGLSPGCKGTFSDFL